MKFNSIIDQIGSTLNLSKQPFVRIVSLVPSQTELLVDLGLENVIVGVTKFCVHPKYIRKDKVIVGGTKTIKLDKIKALSPDIILCNKEENTKEIVEKCSKIAQVHVSNIRTLDDVYELIFQYGVLFSCEKRAEYVVSKIQKECLGFKNYIKNIPHKKVAYCIWRKPWMVAANDTFINHLLELNNFSNAFIDQRRYPEVDVEALTSKKEIDLILLSSEPYPFKNEHIKELQEKNTNAKIKLVDGEYFSWFGSRLMGAFEYFKSLH